MQFESGFHVVFIIKEHFKDSKIPLVALSFSKLAVFRFLG